MSKKSFPFWVLVLGVWLMSGMGQAQQASLPPEVVAYADMVLYNGKIITADDQQSIESAIAIRGGKFLAVGSDDRILQMAGPRTQRIDLQGKSVVPGFIDTHLHQAWSGNVAKRGQSGRVAFTTKESGLEDIRQLVEATAPGEWISLTAPRNVGFFAVTRKDLDPISPNNPIVLVTQGTDTTVNSVALNLAKLPLDTPGLVKDPATGEPTGQLWGGAAGVVIYETKPWPPMRELLPDQKERLAKANSEGLTMIIGRTQGLTISLLKELWANNELTARVRGAVEFLRLNPNGEAFLKRFGNLSGFGDDMFKIIGATVGPVDGSPGDGAGLSSLSKLRQRDTDAFGAFGQNKWLGHGYGGTSPMEWDDVPLEEKKKSEFYNVILANRYGWNITAVHSTGDESTRITLKAYEAANAEKPLEGRWGIDHQPMQTADTTALMKKLNVIPSFYYYTPGGRGIDNMVYLYGADRVNDMVPVRSFLQEGILPVYEADTLSYPFFAPLYNLEMFVTRKNPQAEDPGRVFGEHEKLSRMEALYMMTKWAARYTNEEDILGTIEPGKLADLVVLGGDFLRVPEEQIFEGLPVLMTIVGGKIVYQTDHKVPTNEPEQRF